MGHRRMKLFSLITEITGLIIISFLVFTVFGLLTHCEVQKYFCSFCRCEINTRFSLNKL